jgi:hypothetical protein
MSSAQRNKWLVRFDESLIPIFQQIATQEDRTFTDVARLLVRQALRARGLLPAPRQINNNVEVKKKAGAR